MLLSCAGIGRQRSSEASQLYIPKLGGTIIGVHIIRTIVFWGLYWGPLILGNYHMVGFSPDTLHALPREARVGIFHALGRC